VVVRTRGIYHSANGDRWLLALDSDTDRVFVRHEPNLPSGGQVADIEIAAFLIALWASETRWQFVPQVAHTSQHCSLSWPAAARIQRISDMLRDVSLPALGRLLTDGIIAYTMVERRLILNRIGKGSCETHGKRPRI
jgi:hypothetical protein